MVNLIYDKDGIQLYLGDCLKILPELGVIADIGITSVPYNQGACNVYNFRKDNDNRGDHLFKRYNAYDDNLSMDEYYDLISKSTDLAMDRIKRHLFFNIQILHGNSEAVYRWIGSNSGKIKEDIIWDKGSAQPAVEPGVLNSQFEHIFVLSNINPEKRKFYECEWRGTESNVIRLNRGKNKHAGDHKAVFPKSLPVKLIQMFTKPGETVIDYFCGTGSTLSAAKACGRNAIGIEMDERSCEITIENLESGVQMEQQYE